MPTFRIHYETGDKLDVDAETSAEARGKARARRAGVILKIKRLAEPTRAEWEAERASAREPEL